MKLLIEDVSKRYRREILALRRFSLELMPGVLGLLGPNGAGKTTLMSILATITRATEGRVLWNGVDIATDPDAMRSVLGYLPQDFGIYPNLSAVEFLQYLAAVKGLDAARAARRIEELLELVRLLRRQECDSARPANSRWADSGNHTDEQDLLHAEQGSEQFRSARGHGADTGPGGTDDPVVARGRSAHSLLRTARSGPHLRALRVGGHSSVGRFLRERSRIARRSG